MSLAGTNLEHARGYNRRLVLRMVRLKGPISRASIARETGLSVQAVHNIVDDLSAADLVISRKTSSVGRGKPASEVMINPSGGYTIGISFDHRRLVIVLVDLAGLQQGIEEHRLASPSPEAVLGLVDAAVARLCGDATVYERIWGVGVVIPALIESGSPIAFGPTSVPQWEGFPLAEELGLRLGLPVFMENDATAAAVGEHLYGIGRSLRDFFYIYLGVGIGAGMIFSGHPYRGSAGRAGEFGHLIVVPDGRPCQCGNRGCLERYASLSAAQACLTGVPEGSETVDPQRLLNAFQARDSRICAWIEEAASQMRRALVSVENLIDPETVVLGGILPEPILDALMDAMEPLPPSIRSGLDSRIPRLTKAEVGLETPALGAAALPLFNGLTPSFNLLRDNPGTSPAVLASS